MLTTPTTTPAPVPFDLAPATPLADAATSLTSVGLPVFPCTPGGKAPLIDRGFHAASADGHQVASWWRQHPDANIGIPTGAASGFDVVDIDVHAGKSGFAAFMRAWWAGLAHGWLFAVGTPSGGMHIYYPHADGVEQRSWTTQASVDFRGDGGYVIAPPSRIALGPGQVGTYQLRAASEAPPQPVDAVALRAFLSPPARRPTPSADRLGDLHPEYLAVWVAHRPEGSRNSGLFWAACEMARHGYSSDEALDSLGPAAQHAGLGDREIETTVSSAFRKAVPVTASATVRRPVTHEGVSL